jgi:hypothetical protein
MVALLPGTAKDRYPELIRALEEAYPVRFVGSSARDLHSAIAVIVFPSGRCPDGLRIPCLILTDPSDGKSGASFRVELARCAGLDRALHGQRLVERDHGLPAPSAVENGGQVLAVTDGMPIWVRDDSRGVRCETASALPSELRDGEFLRDLLTGGRFWSLLPLVHFLQSLFPSRSGPTDTRRACFVIDDPNPRLSTYGYVRFPELAIDARECRYHVAIATIPLDLLAGGYRAVNVFREHRSELSLVVHGNDHVRRELERRRSVTEAERMIRSAAARVRRFEERAGIRIDRVMCPPHGGCSNASLIALSRYGFLGLAASRPFPWDGFSGHRGWRLGGWLPAQLTAGGFPVIPRLPLGGNMDDLVFRAMLGLPLIIYCHHTDLKGGLEPFRAAADRVAALGEVEWTSLASVTRGNVLRREQDGMATVTLYARDVRIPTPTTPVLRVEVPRVFDADVPMHLVVNGKRHDIAFGPAGGACAILETTAPVEHLRIQIVAPGGAAAPTLRDWRPRLWPIVRRVMTETRDRSLPVIGGVRRP